MLERISPQTEQPIKDRTQEFISNFDQTQGREIKGLPPQEERFSILKNGIDYNIVSFNQEIHCSKPVTDFFLFINPSGGEEERTIEAPHWRSVNSENIKAQYKNDYFYCANTKGCGFLKPTLKGINFEDFSTWTRTLRKGQRVEDYDNQVLGILNKYDIASEKGYVLDRSQYLVEKGLRTELFWAIAKLEKAYFRGNIKTITELRNLGIFPKRLDFNPFIAIRLLKINNRIAEAKEADNSYQLFIKSFEIFNKETQDKKLNFPILHIKNNEHQKIFTNEFFKRIGQNLAILLNEGYIHYNLHSSNITLAGEIVDIGTMTHHKFDYEEEERTKKYAGVKRGHIKDMRDICYSLKIFLKAMKKNNLTIPKNNEFKSAFFEGFGKKIEKNKVLSQGNNFEESKNWIEKIFNKIIIQNGSLLSLKHYEIEDWNI